MNIFVAKLSYDTNNQDLREVFERFGEVDSAKVIFDRETDRSRGFGFVEMPNEEEANDAILHLNDAEFDGRRIVVKKAKPRESRNNMSSPYNNRNSRYGDSNNNRYGGSYRNRY